MQDNFDYQGFLAKHRLGPFAKIGSLNEELEENAQEDEDGSQVTKGQIYPEPIEVVSMGSNGATIKVRKPNGEVEDIDFELGPEIEEVDPPYGYEGTIYGEIDGEEYGIAVSLVDMGGAGYDMDLSYDGLTFLEGVNHPDDPTAVDVDDEEKDPEDFDDISEAFENDGYQDFLSALSKFVGLKKEGVITEDEYSKIMDACLPIYNRLKGVE
jgi:hypothetical protein